MVPGMELGVCGAEVGCVCHVGGWLGVGGVGDPLLSPYLSLGWGDALDLAQDRRVRTSQVSTQQSLTVHLGLEAGNVAAAEVFAQFVHLLQLQQVDAQHLDGLHHL